MRRTWIVWLAAGGGSGFAPVAPGTFGTLLGVPWAYAVTRLPRDEFVGPVWWLVAIVVTCLSGVWVCTRAARELGGAKDPGAIVLDEILSMPLVFLFVPAERLTLAAWPIWLAGFALHRLFDITKPPPARQLERLPAGWGIMADDIAAALYGAAVLGVAARQGWI